MGPKLLKMLSRWLMTCLVFMQVITEKVGIPCKNKVILWFCATRAPTCGAN
jgi:hypothetical protein